MVEQIVQQLHKPCFIRTGGSKINLCVACLNACDGTVKVYSPKLQLAGLRLSGTSPDGSLVEIVELPDHPWFVGCQFHPEFKSRPNRPHPLFRGFVAAALRREEQV